MTITSSFKYTNAVYNSLSVRFFTFLVILSLFVGETAFGKEKVRHEVTDGRIDIAHSGDAVKLVGQWAFWPKQFVPVDTKAADCGRFEYFPASWSTYRGEKLSPHGYGSYAVTVTGLNPSIQYAFYFPGYSCASRYFANGKELYAKGIPATSKEAERPAWASEVVCMPGSGLTEVTLLLHLSNFNDLYPASPEAVLIGSYDVLLGDHFHKRIMLIISFAAILAMGAYFLSLYAFQHKEHSSLWLGILCIVFALRSACYDEFLIQAFLPGLPAEVMFRLGYLTFSLAVASIAAFVRAQYTDISGKYAMYAILGLSLFYGLCNIAAPVSFFTELLVPFQICCIVSAMYLICVIVRAAAEKRDGAWLFLAGFIFLFLITLHDILIANRLGEGSFLSHYGILGIIAAMALIIVRHFNVAFNSVEAVSEKLTEINASLARFVPSEFFQSLGKHSITDVSLGDHALKDMCVMFVHLGVDVSMGESTERLNMLELFNNILQRVNPVIRKYNGFVGKYLAGGVMVLLPDDSSRAVQCAMEIQKVVLSYNSERDKENLPVIKFAVGLHRGSLMLGTIGDLEHMDGTVISDVVTIASRLQKFALSRGVPIIISDAVAVPLGVAQRSICALVPRGDVGLKGRTEPVSIFEVSEL